MKKIILIGLLLCGVASSSHIPVQEVDDFEHSIYKFNTKIDEINTILADSAAINKLRTVQKD